MKVFISYARADRLLAKKVAKALQQDGLDVWYADMEIMPGDNWAVRIAQGLEEADAMVALLTPDALVSDNVLMEIGFALGKKSFKGRLFPVMVGAQENLQKHIPWILGHIKTIILPEKGQVDEGIRQITRALKEVA
jgi:hypothetical protein